MHGRAGKNVGVWPKACKMELQIAKLCELTIILAEDFNYKLQFVEF